MDRLVKGAICIPGKRFMVPGRELNILRTGYLIIKIAPGPVILSLLP
jgi:hypothetical protein